MSVKSIPTRRWRVKVPEDVRRAVSSLCETKAPNDGRMGLERVSILLRVAKCTIDELVSPGGVVQEKTIVKVRARLEELKRGAA